MTLPCPKVVLDTNYLISALLFARGNFALLRERWKNRRFIPILCTSTTKELIRVLAYPKFHLNQDEIRALLAEILPWADVIDLMLKPEEIPYLEHLRAPRDTDFILLAEQEKAMCLVSGDKHLIELAHYASIPVVHVTDFLTLLDKTSQ